MTQDSVPPLPKSSSNMNGCLIGCLVVVVVGVLGAGILGYTLYKTMQGALFAFTEEAPRELPVLNLSDEQTAAANAKITAFRESLATGQGPREYAFTGDELNVMLRSSEPGKLFGDSVYVTVANSEVRGEVSFNLGTLIPVLDGRYANGSATFNVYTQNGELFVYIESFQVKGEEASQQFMEGMRAQNLSQEAAKNPEFRKWVANIDEIRADGDKLIVKLKDTGASAAPEEGAAPAEAPAEHPAPVEDATPVESSTAPSA